MTKINRSAILPYPVQSMFDLVNDIEAYPEFMDGCVAAQIILKEGDTIEARLDLKRGVFRQQIITRNINTYGKSIDLKLPKGPLSKFSGRWEFSERGPQACEVSLAISFSMNMSIANIGLSKLLNRASDSLVDAVAARARTLYG